MCIQGKLPGSSSSDPHTTLHIWSKGKQFWNGNDHCTNSKIREPSPSRATSKDDAIAITAANEAIESLSDSPKASPSRPGKRKRGEYGSYTPEERAKFAKIANDFGVAKASRKISSDLGKRVSETTIRSMRDEYRKKIKINLEQRIASEIKELPTKIRGRPLMLGDKLDDRVKMFVKNLRAAGGVVNTTIVVAAARGIQGSREINQNLENIESIRICFITIQTGNYMHIYIPGDLDNNI
ncbi:unnamed protein product [Mytilus edulis]|uniref:Uncharacterized protein n=1 Tax=Mytilus edulis TaxID=6550 RepID=A0A8S3QCX7_MYTED|nr:unnamed protein product [Mytilus edulis]